jgi:hypothetical protein
VPGRAWVMAFTFHLALSPLRAVQTTTKASATRRYWYKGTLNRNVCDSYDAETMAALVAKSVGTCLPAVLWLAQDWLTRRARTDADVVRVVRSLRDAHGNPDELRSILVWSGRSFLSRLDGTNPLRAIEAAGLTEQADAWYRGQTKTLPVRKPDPDPPR